MFEKHFHSILLILSLCNISAKDVDFEGEPWPVTDVEGYYQSYKENGKFVNWWHKDMPNFFQILIGFLCYKDESNIPGLIGTFGSSTRFETELEKNIPVEKPYWMVRKMEFEQLGLDMLQFWLKLTGQ